MGKNLKRLLLILSVLTIILSVIYFIFRDSGKNTIENVDLARNNLLIKNFDFSKNLAEQDGFYRVLADTAKFDKNMGKSDLDNCSLEYKTDETSAVFKADKCKYVVDESITLTGNVNGKINDANISSGEKGEFRYSFDNATGVFYNGIRVKGERVNIKSEKAILSRHSSTIEFINNVEVNYEY